MTIYQQYGNEPFDPATTPQTPDGVYDLKDKAEYGFEYCFADFWSDDERQEPGYYRLAANTRIDGRWGVPHVQSLVAYSKWITDVFHMPCYVVRNPCDLDELWMDDREHRGEHGGRLKDPAYKEKVKHDEKHMYGIEVRYDGTHKADQFFTAVCYARFACYEYTQFARTLKEFTPRTLLRDLFSPGFILKLLHMPFIDYTSLFDGFADAPHKPQINAVFGEALHDFAVSVLKGRTWKEESAIDSSASHNSYVRSSEFHTFYTKWRLDKPVVKDAQAPAPAPVPAPVPAFVPAPVAKLAKPVQPYATGLRVFPEVIDRRTYRIMHARIKNIRWDDDKE